MITAPLITDCKQINIAGFRRCLFERDYSALGEGSPAEIEACWLSVRSEYYDLIGGTGITAVLQQLMEVQLLASSIERIEILIAAARLIVESYGAAPEGITEELQAEGYMLDIEGTFDQYLRQLNVIAAKLAPQKMRLASISKELPKPQGPEEEAEALKAAEQDFENTYIETCRFIGYDINEEKTTMYRYCMMVKRAIEYHQAKAKIPHGG